MSIPWRLHVHTDHFVAAESEKESLATRWAESGRIPDNLLAWASAASARNA